MYTLENEYLTFVGDKFTEIPCNRCKGGVIPFSVDNEVWNTVIRRGGPEMDQEYLCAWCFLVDIVRYVKDNQIIISNYPLSHDPLCKNGLHAWLWDDTGSSANYIDTNNEEPNEEPHPSLRCHCGAFTWEEGKQDGDLRMANGVEERKIINTKIVPISYSTIKGPWFSFGFHIDFQKRYIDLHIWWWIITIGTDYYWTTLQSHNEINHGN